MNHHQNFMNCFYILFNKSVRYQLKKNPYTTFCFKTCIIAFLPHGVCLLSTEECIVSVVQSSPAMSSYYTKALKVSSACLILQLTLAQCSIIHTPGSPFLSSSGFCLSFQIFIHTKYITVLIVDDFNRFTVHTIHYIFFVMDQQHKQNAICAQRCRCSSIALQVTSCTCMVCDVTAHGQASRERLHTVTLDVITFGTDVTYLTISVHQGTTKTHF